MICAHCRVEIGELVDPQGGKHGWMHRLNDGPAAYTYCNCRCKDCFDLGFFPAKVAQDYPCCDGEQAEPSQDVRWNSLTPNEKVAEFERYNQ